MYFLIVMGALNYLKVPSSILLMNWLIGLSRHVRIFPERNMFWQVVLVFPPLRFPISLQLAAILPNASSSSASSAASAATAFPAAPPFTAKRTSSLPRSRAPAGPAAPPTPHSPTHGSPLTSGAAPDGATTTNHELPATQLPSASPTAVSTAQKHPH